MSVLIVFIGHYAMSTTAKRLTDRLCASIGLNGFTIGMMLSFRILE